MKRRFAIATCAVLLGACGHTPPAVVSAPAMDSTRDSARVTHRFYANRDYGSEAQFNPLSLIVNGGYDQLRVGERRNIFSLWYRSGIHSVYHSLTDPEAVLRHYGWKNWLTHEVFPLSLKRSGGGQWYPNYHLHLIAGGMTYARTVEWYEQHGFVSHPELAAGATVYAWHFLTEIVESGGGCCEDEDGLTDLTIFDSGAILLWNQHWVRQLFDDGRFEFTDWPGQPSLALPSQRLENAYMMAMFRAPLPRTDDWKVMTTMGNAFLIGMSRQLRPQLWASVSGGFDPVENQIVDVRSGAKGATLLPNAGVFVDRDGSLLLSVITKGGGSNGTTLNIYPGVLRVGAVSPGLWAQQNRKGGWRFGIVSELGFGLSWYTHTLPGQP